MFGLIPNIGNSNGIRWLNRNFKCSLIIRYGKTTGTNISDVRTGEWLLQCVLNYAVNIATLAVDKVSDKEEQYEKK